MLVDDKQAREKCAKICEKPKPECCGNFTTGAEYYGQVEQLCCGDFEPGEFMDGPECAAAIRQTDLSDCKVDTGDAAHLVAALWVAASSEDVDYLQRLIARSAPMVESLSAQAAALTREQKYAAKVEHELRERAEAAEAAEAQVAELKKDAERYRYLRNTCFTSPLRDAFERGGCNLDAAIDAAKESGDG